MKAFKDSLVCLEEKPNTLNSEDLPYLFVSSFNDDALKDFHKSFLKLHADPKVAVIPIVISSFGGQVHSLLGMLDIIQTSDKPVATIASGKAMSCGASLLAAGTKGYRYCSPMADVMIHQVSSMDWGKTEDLKNSTEHTEFLNNKLMRLLAKWAGQKDKEFFIKLLKKKQNVDVYLTPEECKHYGLIDHISMPKFIKKWGVK